MVADLRKRDHPVPVRNYVFVGNPGTGKMTVARLMAKMVSKMGLVEDKYVETTSDKIQASYVGQSTKQGHELMEDAIPPEGTSPTSGE